MCDNVLDTLSFATALSADVLEPYCRIGQRLDAQLIRSLPRGSLTLQACLALTRVPPEGQREIVDGIRRENLELNEHQIAARMTALHQALQHERPLDFLQWLLWMLHALRETPFSPDEAAALEPVVQELMETLRDLRSNLEDRRRQLEGGQKPAEGGKGEVEG